MERSSVYLRSIDIALVSSRRSDLESEALADEGMYANRRARIIMSLHMQANAAHRFLLVALRKLFSSSR